MGNQTSSTATSKDRAADPQWLKKSSVVRGRKTNAKDCVPESPHDLEASMVSEPSEREQSQVKFLTAIVSDYEDDEEDSEDESDYESDDDDDEWNERRRVLAEAAQLKAVAKFFFHPEEGVTTNGYQARCFFDRASAVDTELSRERENILVEAAQLKEQAQFFSHPELGVVSKGEQARCFFDRAAAAAETEANERARILEDALKLRQLAKNYLHPEAPVQTTDSTACGRNYFSRPSAIDEEEAEERARILEETAQLRHLAQDHLHPELSVTSTDGHVCGRNFFSRPSAVPQESEEDAEERARVLEDSKALLTWAKDYMHPEVPVSFEATATGRNYYSRPSAAQQESYEDAEERARILEDSKALRQLAKDYLHPEAPVVAAATACGRNYFSRASAMEEDEAEERARVLEEMAQLRQLAKDCMHPEVPVVTTDAFACGRNYFSRPSAVPQESEEDAEERVRVLEDAQKLRELSKDYLHPEASVVVESTAFGRNYFARASAIEQEDQEDTEERVLVLEEARKLCQLAGDFMHPEAAVATSDATACGRNYFSRASAVQQEDQEEAEERARVLEDAKKLREVAKDYMHPEVSVQTSDPTACGRSYFSRASAAGHAHMIHTFPKHEDDLTDHHEEHFGMDEELDLFADMRGNLQLPPKPSPAATVFKSTQSEEGSNLSRSPSSVMLFNGESIYD